MTETSNKEEPVEVEKVSLLNEPNNSNRFKKLEVNFACMCIFVFLHGIEFAVILPTLWDRLHLDFNASGTFMGLVLSSYMLMCVICGFIMGPISDRVERTKIFYVVGIICTIIGEFLYFMGINKYVILASKLISGVVGGADPVGYAYIAKTTTKKRRLTIIGILMASRQLGLMFGPAFNLFLRKTNFMLFGFPVNRLSSPGLFMAILWIVFLIIIAIFYHDNPKYNFRIRKTAEETNFTLRDYINEFMRFEMFVLLLITFFTHFNQTSLETIVIPFTEIMYGWNELQNSILFCIAGATIIISFGFIFLLESKLKLKEKIILLTGLVLIITGLTIACTCLPFAKQLQDHSKDHQVFNNDTQINSNDTTTIIGPTSRNLNKTYDYQFFPAFIIFVLLDVIGLTAISITSSSIFSKLTRNKMQGSGQAIQRGILGFGTIFGPLCAGPFVQKPIYLLACTLFFILIIFVLYLFSFKLINIESNETVKSSDDNDDD